MRLKTVLALAFAILVVIVIATISIVINTKSKVEVTEEIGGSLATIAYQVADKLDHYMWSRYSEVKVLSQLAPLRDQDIEEVDRLLGDLSGSIPAFSWVGWIDPEGTVLAATGDILVGNNIAQRPVYLEALSETFIGDVHDAVLLSELLPNPTGEPLQFVDISTPVKDELGQLVGILATHLSWQWSKEVTDSIIEPLKGERKEQIEVFVLSEIDNTVLLGPDDLVGKPLTLPHLEKRSIGNEWGVEVWPDGKEYLTGYAYGGGYRDYEGLGWKTIVRQPVSIAFNSAQELSTFILSLGLVSIILFAALGWYLAGMITRPLNRITQAAVELRKGHNVEIPAYRGIKDIEVLANSLRDLIKDLTRTENELERMEDIAQHDKLTGLPNRFSLDLRIEQAIAEAEEKGCKLAFLYMDLDGFKEVNDTLGHMAGDLLLKEVATRLKTTMTDQDYLFRMGGDEFFMIVSVSSEQPVQDAGTIATSILEAVGKPYEIERHPVHISCSMGGAIWPDHGTNPTTLIRDADSALYQSKNEGKNKMTFVE